MSKLEYHRADFPVSQSPSCDSCALPLAKGLSQFPGRIRLMWLSVFGLALMFCGPVRPATYYVNQSHAQANDENPGTEALPWKTINHAAAVVQAGDTVLVKKGTYDVGASPNWAVPAVNPSHSGTQRDPITFKAYLGHAVQITTTGGQAAIGSNSRDYIVWEGFVVNMADRAKGILVMGAKGCTISHCEVIGNYVATTDNHDGIRIERAP